MSELFKIMIGLIFGTLCYFALLPVFASLRTDGSQSPPVYLLVAMGVVSVFCIFAPSVRLAMGLSCFMLGICLLLLPISTMSPSGGAASPVMTKTAATDEGVAVIKGVATFIGFILGAMLVLFGLALSGRREVITVERGR